MKDLNLRKMRSEAAIHKAILGLLLLVFCLAPIGNAQNTDEQDIDRLFQDLKQMLLKRSAPEGLLSPSLTASRRQEEARKVLAPYITLQFKYKLADMQHTDLNEAKLPLTIEWETEGESRRLTDSAQLEPLVFQEF